MTTLTPRSGPTSSPDFWDRWMLGWRILAVVTIGYVAFAVGGSVPSRWSPAPRFWAALGGFAIWYAFSIPLGRDRLYRSLVVSLGYFLPGWVFYALLIDLHPAANSLAAVLYPFTFSMLPTRRAISFSVVLTALMFLAGQHWSPSIHAGTIVAGALITISSIMLALFIDAIIRQSEERKRLIGELEAARESLARAERQAGMLEERQRLAQEIHDTVAQGFVGIVTNLEAAEGVLAAGGGEAGALGHIAAAKESARTSLSEARRMVWDLRPDLRDGGPFPQVIARHLTEWSGRTGVSSEPVVTGAPHPLDPNRESALLQATREALNNVAAHSGATKVVVTLSYLGDEVALDVKDDGRGFDPATMGSRAKGGGGFGLKALAERVGGLGGSLSFESAPGEGTTLTVSLPLG